MKSNIARINFENAMVTETLADEFEVLLLTKLSLLFRSLQAHGLKYYAFRENLLQIPLVGVKAHYREIFPMIL
jgi:hypothetical protein